MTEQKQRKAAGGGYLLRPEKVMLFSIARYAYGLGGGDQRLLAVQKSSYKRKKFWIWGNSSWGLAVMTSAWDCQGCKLPAPGALPLPACLPQDPCLLKGLLTCLLIRTMYIMIVFPAPPPPSNSVYFSSLTLLKHLNRALLHVSTAWLIMIPG